MSKIVGKIWDLRRPSELDFSLLHLACSLILLLADANNCGVVAEDLILDAHSHALCFTLFLVFELVVDGHLEEGFCRGALGFCKINIRKIQINLLARLWVHCCLEIELDFGKIIDVN